MTTIRSPGRPPVASELQRAHKIVVYAHGTAGSLLAGYNSLGQARGRGAPSDEQQDLLRAMLVFAGAGLDACAQQIVRDALPSLAAKHEEARTALVGFAARQLRQSASDAGSVDARVLAILLLGNPEKNVIEMLVDDLTRSSMQSVEELKRVAAHLGVAKDKQLMGRIDGVRTAFSVRNRISHDMDVDFTSNPRRNRTLRRRADMVRDANGLLGVADALIVAVDKAL